MKKEYLLFILLVIMAFAWFTRQRTLKEVPPASEESSASIQMLPAKSTTKPAARPSDLSPAEHGRMMALGIRQTVLPAKNAASISIQFKKKNQWCAVGDLDFIKVQSVSPDQPEWRLSLEQDAPVSSLNVSLEDMVEGRPLTLKFPEKDGVYALYLCKNAGRGSCLTQNLWNPSQRSTKKLAGVVMNAQILVRQKGRILVLPTDNWSRGQVDQLKDVLRKQGLADHKRLDALYKTVGSLKPFAAQFDGSSLQVPLAINDPKCR